VGKGEQENSFGQYSSLSKQFKITTLGNKRFFVWQEPCMFKPRFTKHVGSNLGWLAVIYAMIVIH
jgi:hypothetical protein